MSRPRGRLSAHARSAASHQRTPAPPSARIFFFHKALGARRQRMTLQPLEHPFVAPRHRTVASASMPSESPRGYDGSRGAASGKEGGGGVDEAWLQGFGRLASPSAFFTVKKKRSRLGPWCGRGTRHRSRRRRAYHPFFEKKNEHRAFHACQAMRGCGISRRAWDTWHGV